MVAFREAADASDREAALDRARERLDALEVDERLALARAYTLYLELVNVCENAYRTHRLRERLGPREEASGRARLTLVLTAHPTESRSPENIRVLRRVQDHLVECLEEENPVDEREVKNLIHVAWRVGTHPPSKPSVEDEANHLFSLLTDPILADLIEVVYPGVETPPDGSRADLVSIFLTGIEGLNQPQNVVPSEMLRLNTSTPVTANPDELGVLGGDNQGFPNGRRLGDDVVDIALRAVAGGTPFTPEFNRSPNNAL
ncbi:MAG: phosphoenolpyruvate carboxylase, partial [Gemmatimonadetes bacterium]|nr:phosphoenolpyruvate carboxylase [Gemmatimonadota bacterium]